jgi:signal transduction histidine kinase
MTPRSSTIFSDGGEMGEGIRKFDWSKTPVGPMEDWPQSLITSIQIMLASRQPIWVAWGAELTYFYNDPYKAIIGGRHPSALGKPMREVWPELWPFIEPMLQRALAGTEGIYVEEQLLIMERHGFKEETYYTYSFTPIPNDGGIGGIICFNTDDTQRVIGQRRISLLGELAACANARRGQEACDRAKAALATNSKDLPFALLYLLDSSGQKLELACAIGISRDHPAVPASMRLTDDRPWPVAQVLQSNSFRVVDIGHYSELPHGFWAQPPGKAVVLPLNTGAEAAHAGVVIAALNPYLQWRERYQSFLSVVVSQIAAAVANARAYEAERKSFEREQAARREAEKAIRAKDQFLATLSHELRTPLGPALLIASDAVADPNLPPNVRAQFQVILRNIEVEAQLIDDLLDLSRVTYGKLNLNMRTVDAHRLLREAVHTVQPQLENKGIQMAIDLKAEKHLVSADPVRLQQIFWNVLRNAVKFTPERGTIRVETFQPDGNGRFGVTITDSGMGMTPEELNKAFTAFAQGEHTEDGTSNHGGLGLGLAISKRLVELHSGSIQAKSDGRGRGSAFTIEFPLAKGSSE